MEIIAKLGSQKVTSVVTDHALNMRLAWDIIEEKYPHIFCNCRAEDNFNLLIQDVCQIEEIAMVLSKCCIYPRKNRSCLLLQIYSE